MSENGKVNASRRAVLRRYIGAAIVASTSASFVAVAASSKAKPGTRIALRIKGGGVLNLTADREGRWQAVVVDRGTTNSKPNGMLLLENGKVVGLKDGLLRLGQFGSPAADFEEFQEFTEFTETSGRPERSWETHAVLARQLADLRGLRTVKITPKVTLDLGKISG